MSVKTLDIIWNKPDKVYYPGEMVSGRVRLVVDSAKKIRAVDFKLKGKAECKWDEQETYRDREGRSRSRKVCRKSSETYVKTEQCLVGGKDKFKLAAGEHIYPFCVTLPICAPASFSGSYGGVSYYARVKIDITKNKSSDKKERTYFNVLDPLNLNLFPNLRTSYKNEKNKTFGSLCCISGGPITIVVHLPKTGFAQSEPIPIIVHLPKTGFAQSEPIPITLEIDNASPVFVSAVHIDLKREMKWTSEGRDKYEDLKLTRLSLDGVKQGTSHTWSEHFTIPSVSYPNLESCSYIKMNHELHIHADPPRLHSDLDMHIPITIGDIPLSEDPNAPPINTPQPQAYPNHILYNPNSGMQMPTPGVPMTPVPSPYPARGHPAANYPYPVVPGNQASEAHFGVPAPNSNYIAPNPFSNVGGIPQMSLPPTAQGYPQPNYLTSAYPVPGGAVPVQQYYPELSRQPSTRSTNHESWVAFRVAPSAPRF
ncbi:arrestin domain-containing protein 1-like isoform X2 [Planococcus citri]|uniref:arrestin domain-containing protein 1-like isoform X2 n=1 Tax=Planococcus citri TaxID=170843 RepID=UPI0031F9F4A1